MTIDGLFGKIQTIITIREEKFLSRNVQPDLTLVKSSIPQVIFKKNKQLVQKQANDLREALTLCQQIIFNPDCKNFYTDLEKPLFPSLIKRLELKCKTIASNAPKTSKEKITKTLSKKILEVKHAAISHYSLNSYSKSDKDKFVAYCQSLGSFSSSSHLYVEMFLHQKFLETEDLISLIYKIVMIGGPKSEKASIEFRELIFECFWKIVAQVELSDPSRQFLKNIFYQEGVLYNWLPNVLKDFKEKLKSFFRNVNHLCSVEKLSSEEKLCSIYQKAKQLENFWKESEQIKTLHYLSEDLLEFKNSCIRNLLLDMPTLFTQPQQKEKLTQIYCLFEKYTPLEKVFALHFQLNRMQTKPFTDLLIHYFFDKTKLSINEEWKRVMQEYCTNVDQFLECLYSFSLTRGYELPFLEKLMCQSTIEEFPAFFVKCFLICEESILVEKLCTFFVKSSSPLICQNLESCTNVFSRLEIRKRLDRFLKLYALAKENKNAHIKQACLKIFATILPYYFYFYSASGIWKLSNEFMQIDLMSLPFNDFEINEIISYISPEVKKEIECGKVDLKKFPQVTREGFKFFVESFPTVAFINAYSNEKVSDIQISCSEGTKGFIYVHSTVLSKASNYFAHLLNLSLMEGAAFAELNKASFFSVDVDPVVFDFLKKWIPTFYEKNMNLDKEPPTFLLKQLILADYFGMTFLVYKFDAILSQHFQEKSESEIKEILKEGLGVKKYFKRLSYAERIHIPSEHLENWLSEMNKFPNSRGILNKKLAKDVQASM